MPRVEKTHNDPHHRIRDKIAAPRTLQRGFREKKVKDSRRPLKTTSINRVMSSHAGWVMNCPVTMLSRMVA